MAARSKGVSTVVGIVRNRLVGVEETGGGDNNNIGAIFGGGRRRGIELGLSRIGGVSGSERVNWSGMERGRRVINLDRRRDRNIAGRDDVVAKT